MIFFVPFVTSFLLDWTKSLIIDFFDLIVKPQFLLLFVWSETDSMETRSKP